MSKAGSKSNFSSDSDGDAVTYGLGSDGGYVLNEPKNYSSPTMVDVLPPQQKIASDEKVAADETPSVIDFYDGSSKLNKLPISCKIFANLNDCLSVSNCGWCASRNSCVSGTAFGPLVPCDKTSYIFQTPHKPVDPRVKALISGINPVQFSVRSK